ncbi:MAG: 3-methyladenine DNA glycosylase [Kineosporiaceae bacterium]|nr:3-methyladenine DNA glycosylase [Kineosporiaceae bacterium]
MNELPPPLWRARQAAHERRVDRLVGPHLARRARGEKHAVEDFLFTYYSLRPARLRRWHPGAGVTLILDDGRRESLDVAAFLARRGEAVRHLADLLRATASRPAHLGCFGLHEWAMVYKHGADDERRHPAPLRLGAAGSDAVVEAHRIRCSHFDAFRFFTPDAMGRNELQPTRSSPPATSSELIADCFELAREARALDMQASPYDVRSLGYEPIPIETAEGKAAYVVRQRELIARAEPLRARLIEVCEALLGTEALTESTTESITV